MSAKEWSTPAYQFYLLLPYYWICFILLNLGLIIEIRDQGLINDIHGAMVCSWMVTSISWFVRPSIHQSVALSYFPMFLHKPLIWQTSNLGGWWNRSIINNPFSQHWLYVRGNQDWVYSNFVRWILRYLYFEIITSYVIFFKYGSYLSRLSCNSLE